MTAETIFNDVNFKFTLLKLKLTNFIFITYLFKIQTTLHASGLSHTCLSATMLG